MRPYEARQICLHEKSVVTAHSHGKIVRFNPRLLGATIEIYHDTTGVRLAEFLFADAPVEAIELIAREIRSRSCL